MGQCRASETTQTINMSWLCSYREWSKVFWSRQSRHYVRKCQNTTWRNRNSSRNCQTEPTLDQLRLYWTQFSVAAPQPSERPITVSLFRPHGVLLYRREDFTQEVASTSSAISAHIRGHLMTSLGFQRGTRRSLSFLWHFESVENNSLVCHNLKFHQISPQKKKKNVQ